MSSKGFHFSRSLLALTGLLLIAVFECEAIINGENAKSGEFPFIVSLRNKTGKHYCAGTLISPRHIVTSAQCIYEDDTVFNRSEDKKLNVKDISVVVGTLSPTEGGDSYEVEKFIPHPNHNMSDKYTFKQDVAVIFLKNNVTTANYIDNWFDNTVPPKVGTTGTVAGWGYTTWDPPTKVEASTLQKMTVKIQDKDDCKKEWRSALTSEQADKEYIPNLISLENIICGRPVVNNASGSVRDVGDPFVIDNKVVGFLIGGHPSATGIANFYTSLFAHRSFVQDAIAGSIQ